MASQPVCAGSDVWISGGGMIREGTGTDARIVTFALDILTEESQLFAGHVQMHFHKMDDIYALDNSRFSAAEFDEVFVQTRDFEGVPYSFIRIRARGRLDGEDGWSVLLRFADFGPPLRNGSAPASHSDAVRIILMDPDYQPDDPYYYDTAFDFPRDQSWRTLLDGGNVSVHVTAGTDAD